MIRWALFSTLAAGLFYGLYLLLLRRDRWLQLSRVYLLTTLAFSLVYPLVRLPEVELPLPTFGDAATLPMMEFTVEGTPAVEPAANMTEPHNGMKMLPMIYFIGLAASLLALTAQIIRTTIGIRRVSSQTRHQHMMLHLTDDSTPPYSFFNHIVVGTNGMDEEQLQCILAHEELHVRQRHTNDMLIARTICCIAWFNPFAWLYVKELRAVHEYLADDAVLAAHGRKGYLGLLYREATGIGYGHITNNFHSINLKKRITMMNRKKSRFGAWKLLAALPVAAMLMMVGCKPAPAADTAAEPVVEPPAELTDITTVDVDPAFPEGVEAMYKYFAENIHYPEAAKAAGEEGRVFVRFVVEADGSITGTEVVRGIGGECDAEALRVINAMPKWTPGMKGGKPVRVQYTVPIVFKLNE